MDCSFVAVRQTFHTIKHILQQHRVRERRCTTEWAACEQHARGSLLTSKTQHPYTPSGMRTQKAGGVRYAGGARCARLYT